MLISELGYPLDCAVGWGFTEHPDEWERGGKQLNYLNVISI